MTIEPKKRRCPLRLAARRRARCGSVLVEFALIALVFTTLVGAILAFGVILGKANIVQQAADVGAQELARMPLNPALTTSEGTLASLNDVLYSNDSLLTSNPGVMAVREQIFDEQYLYWQLQGTSLYADSASWPLLNRLLVPMMIYDVDRSAGGAQVFRYPGAVVTNNQTGQTTVVVPLVIGRDSATGVETIEWHRVVEDPTVTTSNPYGSFSVAANAVNPGVVNLRVFCPVQTAMISFRPNPGNAAAGEPLPNIAYVNQADDAAVSVTDPFGIMSQYTLAPPASSSAGTDSGEYGLGYFLSPLPILEGSSPGSVRPFSVVEIGQGFYRREVFGP